MLSNAIKLAAALSVVALPAFAQNITASDAFARETPPSAKVGGAFVSLTNSGDDDTLTAAESPVADRIELHNHTMIDGIMKMREVEGGIPLPSGETVMLKPGGLHIMLMGLKQPLKKGETLPLTLHFESGETLALDVPVMKIGSMGMKHSH